MSNFGPITPRDAEVFSATSLITRVQYEIEKELKRRNLSQKDLAGRLGVSPARVNQMLNDNGNMTLRTLGRIAHVLELKLKFTGDKRDAGTRAVAVSIRDEALLGLKGRGARIHSILIASEKSQDDSVRRVMSILRHAHSSARSSQADNENGLAELIQVEEKAVA